MSTVPRAAEPPQALLPLRLTYDQKTLAFILRDGHWFTAPLT